MYFKSEILLILIDSLGGLDIRYNSETGQPEWKERGADTFNPFSSKASIIYLGNNREFNLGLIVGTDNISKYDVSDFIVGWDIPGTSSKDAFSIKSGSTVPHYIYKKSEFVLSYNSSTGEVIITDGVMTVRNFLDYNWTEKNYEMPPKVWLVCKTPNPVVP